MPNSSPDSCHPAVPDNAAFHNSSMLRRIRRNEIKSSLRQIGRIAALIAAGALAVVAAATVSPDILSESPMPGRSPLTVCNLGDLDCMDEQFEEDQDDCSDLTMEEQLVSPLCCFGSSPNPENCPVFQFENLQHDENISQ